MFGVCQADLNAIAIVGLAMYLSYMLMWSSFVRSLPFLQKHRVPLAFVLMLGATMIGLEVSLGAVAANECGVYQGAGFPCWWLWLLGCACNPGN